MIVFSNFWHVSFSLFGRFFLEFFVGEGEGEGEGGREREEEKQVVEWKEKRGERERSINEE